jgi:class 3 adenylate cyclase
MHHSILVVDMTGYGKLNNRGQLQARAILDKSMNAAIRTIGLAQAGLAINHRGDGVLVVVPPTISKADLLEPLLPRLARTIHAANADPAVDRIRLRVAVHAGELIQDATGWFGTDLNLACRLVDAEAAYARLRASSESDVVLIVSDVIYQGVIRHGYHGLDPADYQRVRVRVKEVDAIGWLRTWPTTRVPKSP